MKLTKAQQATAEKMKELVLVLLFPQHLLPLILCDTHSFTQGLSEARIKAYLKKDENPNAYYYRFNDIGEQQATGNWTDDERG